jgi:hypothetical protein
MCDYLQGKKGKAPASIKPPQAPWPCRLLEPNTTYRTQFTAKRALPAAGQSFCSLHDTAIDAVGSGAEDRPTYQVTNSSTTYLSRNDSGAVYLRGL